MKLSDNYEWFNGMCRGCQAAIAQKDIDPDEYYAGWLCGRCRRELEDLPRRHKIVFDRLKRDLDAAVGRAEHRTKTIAVLEGFIVAHGLNPQEADDSYAPNYVNRLEPDRS